MPVDHVKIESSMSVNELIRQMDASGVLGGELWVSDTHSPK